MRLPIVPLLFASAAFANPAFRFSRRDGSVPALDGGHAAMSPNATGEYPRSTNKRSDGSMIGAYTLQTGNEYILKSVKSTDGGATWSPLGEVFRGAAASHDIDNPFPFILKNGRILYAYRNHDRVNSGPETFFRISISYSDDGGVTFKYLATVDQRAANGVNGLWEPFIRYAHDGTTLQCYYSSENNKDDQDSMMKTSTDGGATWSAAKTISGADTLSRDGMLGVAPIDNNGALIAVFENTETGIFTVDSVTSTDDGATWGNRQRVFTPANGKQAGAPQVWNVFGTLVVSFMTDEDFPDSTGYGDHATKIMTSTDGGKTWGNKFTVFPDKANWPGMALLDRNHLLVMAGVDGEGAVAQKIQLK